MSAFRKLPRHFRLPWRSREAIRVEVDEELEFHLAMRTEELAREGVDPDAARAQAEREFGSLQEAQRTMRRADGGAERDRRRAEWIGEVREDLRFGWRRLGRSPGFAAVAVLTLALGIGANTAIFSLVDATLLRVPAHVREPERLVKVYTSDFSGPVFGTSSFPDYLDLRSGLQALSSLAASGRRALILSSPDGAEMVGGQLVTDNYFEVLGVAPALGRLLAPVGGGLIGRDAVVVLSHDLWRRRFGSDPSVLGRAIRVNGQPLTVIGVTPKGFGGATGRERSDLWVPIGIESLLLGGSGRLDSRGSRWLEVVGRLAPDATPERASFQLSALAQSLFERFPEQWTSVSGAPRTLTLLPGARSWIPPNSRGGVVGFLTLIAGLVVLVLLIACANLANLLVARSVSRRREIAVRTALGASWRRIARQLLTESVLLALLAGGVGVLLATGTIGVARRLDGLLPLPLSLDLRVDGRVLVFTLIVSLGTVIFFGIPPAWLAARQDPVPVLKEDAGSGGRRGGLLRGVLVAGQVSVCALLLVCATLLTRSLRNAASTELGFDPHGILLVPLQLRPEASEAEARVIYRELSERVSALPGVDAVALASVVPLGERFQRAPVSPSGYAAGPGEDMEIDFNVVSPGYFEVLGMPLLRGRAPIPSDREGGAPIAIINESFAARFWPGEDALGKRFRVGGDDDPEVEVVGIVRDGKLRTLHEEPRPTYWLPLGQASDSRMTLHVRTSGDPATLLPSVRASVAAVDSDIPTTGAVAFERAVAGQVLPLRLASALFSAFGLLALATAMVGLYGVLANAVSHRVREFGIRIALGAQPKKIVLGVVWEGLSLTAVGAVVGLIAAVFAGRAMTGFLFGVRPTDPAGFLGITLLLLAIAVLASYLPARRVTRIDPMVALRRE